MSPAKKSVQATSPGDSALAVRHEYNPQVPTRRPQGLQMQEGDVDHPDSYPVRPSYQPTREERHQANQGQVTQWDKFSDVRLQPREQWKIFGPHHCHQASPRAEGDHPRCWECFGAVAEVRKQLEPLRKQAPKEGKTKGEKDGQRKKFSAIKEDLKAACKIAVAETMKTYKLFCCFIISKAGMQWDKIEQEMHLKDPWVGINGQS